MGSGALDPPIDAAHLAFCACLTLVGACGTEPAPAAAKAVVDASIEDVAEDVEEPEEEIDDDEPVPMEWVYDDWRTHHTSNAPCPEEMVYLERRFCVDRWEGSLVQITLRSVRPFPPTKRVRHAWVRAISAPGVIPQSYISGAEAQRACQMAGKRLCTDWEWFAACAGKARTIYPYGTVHQKGACNEERRQHPMTELYGADAGPDIWLLEPMNNPAINEQPNTVAPTGAFALCTGPTGIFDMIGNLHEWTRDIDGTFWGGAYSTNNRAGCQYSTKAHPFWYHDYSTGFRCCSDPWDVESGSGPH